jgi:hypothetical protein
MKRLINVIIYIFAIIGFILVVVYIALQTGFTNTKGIIDNQHDYFKNQIIDNSWAETEEWMVLRDAIKKDVDVINRVSRETGIPSRIIVAPLVVEQMRLFSSEREIFKVIFSPLKILGNQSQFSWGVMGIKQDTAKEIELNLKNPQSLWYLGQESENILDFESENPNNERFERLTDEHNRYYSYLYGALYIKQIEKQWKDAGFPIDNKPGIIATLFNIGFRNSKPNKDPQTGGAEIEINKTTYSFGGLAQSFYDSNELIEEFP